MYLFHYSIVSILAWSISMSCILAKIIVDVHEDPYQCQEGVPLPASDFSGLVFDLDDDDNLVFSGVVNITEDYESPIGMILRTEHFERGKWNTGLVGRVVKDFCPIILNRNEIWYSITKNLNQTWCPYRKGHFETFDRVKIGTFGVVLPYHLLGEWKLFFEMTTRRNGQMVKECIMRRVDLSEG